MVTLDFTGNGT